MRRLERHVRDPAVRWAKDHGILHERNHKGRGAANGFPDDKFYYPGGHLFMVEFKAPGKPASALQAKRIRDFRRMGFDIELIDNREKAIAALAERVVARPRVG